MAGVSDDLSVPRAASTVSSCSIGNEAPSSPSAASCLLLLSAFSSSSSLAPAASQQLPLTHANIQYRTESCFFLMQLQLRFKLQTVICRFLQLLQAIFCYRPNSIAESLYDGLVQLLVRALGWDKSKRWRAKYTVRRVVGVRRILLFTQIKWQADVVIFIPLWYFIAAQPTSTLHSIHHLLYTPKDKENYFNLNEYRYKTMFGCLTQRFRRAQKYSR
jgi:hypothetical protein